MNAKPTDVSTPYMDIIERTGSGPYDVELRTRLGDLSGLSSGYLIANFLGFSDKEKKTIAIEVGMQNSGFGMALALIHFSKISALPSAIFSLWHNISAVGLVYFWKKK